MNFVTFYIYKGDYLIRNDVQLVVGGFRLLDLGTDWRLKLEIGELCPVDAVEEGMLFYLLNSVIAQSFLWVAFEEAEDETLGVFSDVLWKFQLAFFDITIKSRDIIGEVWGFSNEELIKDSPNTIEITLLPNPLLR